MNKDDVENAVEAEELINELVEINQAHEIIIESLQERMTQLVEQYALERSQLSKKISELQEENNTLKMNQGIGSNSKAESKMCFNFNFNFNEMNDKRLG